MKIDILTLFPDMFSAMTESIIGRAQKSGKIQINIVNIRDYTTDKHLKCVAVRMVYQVYDKVKIPIVGMGGIATAEDVIEMMLAGATCVQVGAQNLVDPYACPKIIDALPAVMEKYGITNLKDIIGGAH